MIFFSYDSTLNPFILNIPSVRGARYLVILYDIIAWKVRITEMKYIFRRIRYTISFRAMHKICIEEMKLWQCSLVYNVLYKRKMYTAQVHI